MECAVPLELSQVEQAGTVLGRAFQTDPPTIFIFPDPERRLPLLTSMFTGLTKQALVSNGGAFTLEQPLAVAVWYRIYEAQNDQETESGEDMPEFMSEWRDDELERGARFINHLRSSHQRLMPEPHGYLNFLGVDPAHQGKGMGGILIRAVLEHFRALNLPCYLETAAPRNVQLYERHGFRVIEESDVPDSPVHLWAMRCD